MLLVDLLFIFKLQVFEMANNIHTERESTYLNASVRFHDYIRTNDTANIPVVTTCTEAMEVNCVDKCNTG